MDYDRALALIGPSEGNISHLYLDVNGFVTVGIGNMLPDAESACALRFVRNGKPTEEVDNAEITNGWIRVRQAQKGFVASSYRPLTDFHLPEQEIARLFRRRVDEFVAQLTHYFPLFGDFPPTAQLGILDMAFNLGSRALATKWPHFSYAVQTQNWPAAAEHCRRPQSHDARNAAVKELFLTAAREVGALPGRGIT